MGQPSRITRRAAALGAIGAAQIARSQTPATYAGALAGFENKVDAHAFDPVEWTLGLHDSAPLQLTFRARTRAEAEAWQKQLRAKIIALLGGFPHEPSPLRAQTLEVREFPSYTREKFVFESRPRVGVLGYLLTPRGAKKPLPAVVCLPGHGRGADDIVGIDEHGNDRTDGPGYQRDFAITVAQHGMAAVAIEPLAFGCRRDPVTKAKGLSAYACQPIAGSALLLGQTMIGWRVYDVMRTLDWIETRAELDSRRVGCMGISGGGTVTLFSAALEPRIRAAFVSGYLNTFRASIMSVSHCIDNYVPGILNFAEMYDVAGLIAPRPFFAEGGDNDPIFPASAAQESFARVKKIYEIFGAADAIGQDTFSGVHEFHGARGIPFLATALS